MKLSHKVRFITATSLFDGHDAAIHIIRRILQQEGAEVIHLGHNRSAEEVVRTAIQEDAQGIAVSSYQGGHIEYFTYMLDLLKKANAAHIQIFGGGGGVITKQEIALLEEKGVAKIYSPDDGLKMGLVGMIQDMLAKTDHFAQSPAVQLKEPLLKLSNLEIAQILSTIELGSDENGPASYKEALQQLRRQIQDKKSARKKPIVGITGTGGAGKSSLIDELLCRFLQAFPDKNFAVLSVDPTKMRTGGALLGDRIRYNSARNPQIYVRSMATRKAHLSLAEAVKECLSFLTLCNFDLVILETAGIGQSDSQVKECSDIPVYVMTPEYGAPSQLEKIDMLDFAQLIAINKFDKAGALDALRDVRKTYQRNHQKFQEPLESMPVYPTNAHHFGDLGTNRFFNQLVKLIQKLSNTNNEFASFNALPEGPCNIEPLIPKKRSRYLSEITGCIKDYHSYIEDQGHCAGLLQAFETAIQEENSCAPQLQKVKAFTEQKLDPELKQALTDFPNHLKNYESESFSYDVRGKTVLAPNFTVSLSKLPISKIKGPSLSSDKDIVRFLGKENFPGFFPFTAGVFPFKRSNEDATRMFAGEGIPERTNQRFHYLSKDHKATRLSTAFDSVTLYGENPALRPDIYGKIGNSGVSVCSLDDAKRLYSGFDLSAPNTSVSMTINGPAPTLLAFFFNAAIDSACEQHLRKTGQWAQTEEAILKWFKDRNSPRPIYRESLPENHNGLGLGFLGLSADLIMDKNVYAQIKADVLKSIRGTIQADILKEEQAQNTCIFSVDFSMRMMADVQSYFIQNNIRNFYSVSISGYHIAEAGANPISQLAFTLANGFTLAEYYRARGMNIDDFARNLSFFFSNGLDPEYAVIGRVARRIWAIAMKKLYGANERSQKLKYHIQTSGRSLHAQEMAFNDIRTTLQAFYAIADNCNSLHTNAYDEAITTPTQASVRRAVAIQMIINHELGLTKNQNSLQGSYFIEYLTDLVEKAVLDVFDSLDARGGVLGAMESNFQRSQIQEESLDYERKKNSGELPIMGVNTFLDDSGETQEHAHELRRSSSEEKNMQVAEVQALRERFAPERLDRLSSLKKVATSESNVFAQLMETAKYCSLGDITQAFYEVGGAYRRSM